ncbi:hypothetical protein COOONC_28178 [Cooperia oncophora]
MPAPKDVGQPRAFLGIVNLYGMFVNGLHNLRAPVDALTKKDAIYSWTPNHRLYPNWKLAKSGPQFTTLALLQPTRNLNY